MNPKEHLPEVWITPLVLCHPFGKQNAAFLCCTQDLLKLIISSKLAILTSAGAFRHPEVSHQDVDWEPCQYMTIMDCTLLYNMSQSISQIQISQWCLRKNITLFKTEHAKPKAQKVCFILAWVLMLIVVVVVVDDGPEFHWGSQP